MDDKDLKNEPEAAELSEEEEDESKKQRVPAEPIDYANRMKL